MVAHGRSRHETSVLEPSIDRTFRTVVIITQFFNTSPHTMFHRLTSSASVVSAQRHIAELIAQHAEWFLTPGQSEVQALRRYELEVSVQQDRLVLSCWTDKGNRSWRILGWHWSGQILYLQASRRMGAERPVIEMIPRASAAAVAATIRASRQHRCDQIAQLTSALELETKIERSTLSPGIRRGQPGRYARIVLRRKRERIAVTGSVISSSGSGVDALLSASLLWFKRTSERARSPYIEQLWLIVSEDLVQPLFHRVMLLRDSVKSIIKIFVVDDELMTIKEAPLPDERVVWKRRLARFPPVPPAKISKLISEIIVQAPDAIDVVHARHGETIRYFGLPFARARSLLGVEKIWFGIEGAHRQVLDQRTLPDFYNLMAELRQYRCAGAMDHRHAFYRNAAEAWLESLLRKDITKLDPGMIIAPIHAQFRTARGGKLGVRPIDMLALRQDGRLVVIELKVSEDREHVLQGADYWRRVEAHRRRGHIAKAKLFGGRKIRDESPLVYLVAPTLRFHPSFQTLARCVSTEIELYRFDINEDWRSGVRVMRRMKVN
ncbi:MAG: hypothetical protein C5B55_13905 [Blastocatellia bacterium]|nr:MAG: hypothetical protein C5B55_13905 [Blastocatellia bacterium]